MAKTIVGLFDNFSEAQQVVQQLTDAGFDRNTISLVANQEASGQGASAGAGGGEGIVRDTDGSGGQTAEYAGTGAKAGAYAGGALGLLVGLGALAIPGVGPVIAAGPLATALGSTALGAGLGAATGGLIGGLVGLGVPEEEAGYYAEGVRRGGTLVSVASPDDRVDEAVTILNRHNAVDIDQRGSYYRQGGFAGFDSNAKPFSATEIQTYRGQNPNVYRAAGTTSAPAATGSTSAGTTASAGTLGASTTVNAGEHQTIPIVEESLHVGKREVEQGGARIHTSVTETPVQEQVTLREEHVTVDRRPVDRAVSDTDLSTFREGTIEVTERAEVPVVAKEARVVEEVVVGKETTERTETVRDTVRRTDVDVEELNTTDTSVTQTMPTKDANTRSNI